MQKPHSDAKTNVRVCSRSEFIFHCAGNSWPHPTMAQVQIVGQGQKAAALVRTYAVGTSCLCLHCGRSGHCSGVGRQTQLRKLARNCWYYTLGNVESHRQHMCFACSRIFEFLQCLCLAPKALLNWGRGSNVPATEGPQSGPDVYVRYLCCLWYLVPVSVFDDVTIFAASRAREKLCGVLWPENMRLHHHVRIVSPAGVASSRLHGRHR
mmetsp:Transcript_29341/g.61672  ORF Transcript_29341/g.61672 Transcript_29341/m.61672 type:complete len:209 (+) Transcript_29341:13-639(+)